MKQAIERTFQTGWFALHPTTGPRLAYAELTVRLGHSARAEIFWESPDTDDGVYNGIDLQYMRSRASVATFMCLDPFDSWTREGTSKLPTDLRAPMRGLVDGAETDLNELFTILVAQDAALVAALNTGDLGDAVSGRHQLPGRTNVWRPSTNVTIQSIQPWWDSGIDDRDQQTDDDLGELAEFSPEAAKLLKRMGNFRPMS